MPHPSSDRLSPSPEGEARGSRTPVGSRADVPEWLPWLILGASLAVSLVWKGLCLEQAEWSERVQYRLFCYSDITALWFTRGFSEGLIPYLDEVLEYPPLIGLQIGVLAAAVRWVGGDAAWFLSLNALVNAAAAGWILHLLRRQGLDSRRLLWWAAAPPLILYAFHNWDVPALALLVWAITLHREGRDGLSGIAAGLGISAKWMPVLVLPLFVVARLRERRPAAALWVGTGAAAMWVVINLPVAFAAPEAWSRFFLFSTERGPTIATLWAALHRWGVLDAGSQTVNLVSGFLLLTGSALIVIIGVSRFPPVATWSLILPTMAWFLATTKVFSPQFDLWLIPLLVMAGQVSTIGWLFAADAFVFFSELSFLGDRAPYPLLAAAVLVRLALLLWIVVQSLRTPAMSGFNARSAATSWRRPPLRPSAAHTRWGQSR